MKCCCYLRPYRCAMGRFGVAVGLFALLGLGAPAQQTDAGKLLGFEVATIKPAARMDGAWRLSPTPDGYSGMDVSLYMLVREAFGIYDPKLIAGGPSWIDNDRYDLEAKFDAGAIPDAKSLPYRQRADMLQPLLADRFRLKVHFETKDFPVYNLVVGKGGSKLQPSPPEHSGEKGIGGMTCLHGREGSQGCPVGALLDELRYSTGRTVIDKTGITGLYDYSLRYSTANTPADSPAAAYPDIFTAVQEQLGLKLEPGTAPLSVLVIDSAEKPSAN